MYGSATELQGAVEKASIYRRRLAQSGIALVAVSKYAPETAADSEPWPEAAVAAEREGWLWRPTDGDRWREYFKGLLATGGAQAPSSSADKDGGAWLALSLRGRSCASGVGAITWDELLGTKLAPLSSLSPAEASAPTSGEVEESVMRAQRTLYDALAAADVEAVRALFAPVDEPEVNALKESGRLDEWATVLKYDATVGMRLASQDARVAADGRSAYTTALEFPQSGAGGSLLCTQKWLNVNPDRDGPPIWRLLQHRTIPYTEDVDAAACLRCDHRGCVALQRAGPRGPAGMLGDGKA